MKMNEITLLGQYIKDLSFEHPMAPNLPQQNKNPTVNLDVNSAYLDLKIILCFFKYSSSKSYLKLYDISLFLKYSIDPSKSLKLSSLPCSL